MENGSSLETSSVGETSKDERSAVTLSIDHEVLTGVEEPMGVWVGMTSGGGGGCEPSS